MEKSSIHYRPGEIMEGTSVAVYLEISALKLAIRRISHFIVSLIFPNLGISVTNKNEYLERMSFSCYAHINVSRKKEAHRTTRMKGRYTRGGCELDVIRLFPAKTASNPLH